MKILRKIYIPMIGIALVALVYGGLSFYNLEQKINTNNQSSRELKNKIIELENKISALKPVPEVAGVSNTSPVKTTSAKDNIVTTEHVTQTHSPITTTSTSPIVNQNQATVTIQNIGSFIVNIKSGDTAFSILQRAGKENNITLSYDTYSFGVFIKSIGGIVPGKNQFWAFYYNGSFSNVGAGDQEVKNNDQIFWQLSSF